MRQVSSKWLAAVSALVLALIAAPSQARTPHRDYGTAEHTQTERRATVDRNQAAAIVQRSTGGRVLAVETATQGGRTVHRVKVLLSGGRVRVVTVDGQTGEIY